jgi:hypothetical protein
MSWDDLWTEPAPPGVTPEAPRTSPHPDGAPTEPAWSTPVAPVHAKPAMSGLRKGLATALLAAGLLAVGGVAIANAADPSTSPAPSQASPDGNGSGSGGTTTPQDPQTSPGQPRQGGAQSRAGHLCPNKGGGSNDSDSGSNGSTTPNAPSSPDTSGV